MPGTLDRWFGLHERGTDVATAVRAGLTTHVAIKVLNGRGARVHWMLYLAAAAFVVYFLLPVLERRLT